jgi:hypothetical protein
MPTSATQLWTPERATSALPLLRRIADDLVRTYAEWRDLVGRFELASVTAVPGRANAEAERLQKEVLRAATEIEGFMQELAELGVECKSPETGLFDFPSEREGRPVYLCWMRGEHTVSHWHDLEAGFAGRQSLE